MSSYTDYRRLQGPAIFSLLTTLPNVDYKNLQGPSDLYAIKVRNISDLDVGLSTVDSRVLQRLIADLNSLHASPPATEPAGPQDATNPRLIPAGEALTKNISDNLTNFRGKQRRLGAAIDDFKITERYLAEYKGVAQSDGIETAAAQLKAVLTTLQNLEKQLYKCNKELGNFKDSVAEERAKERPLTLAVRYLTSAWPRHWFDLLEELKWTTDMIRRLNELRSVFSMFQAESEYINPENATVKAYRDALSMGIVSLYESRHSIKEDQGEHYKYVRNALDYLKATRNRISHSYGKAAISDHVPGPDYIWFRDEVPLLLGHLKKMLPEITNDLLERAGYDIIRWNIGHVANEYKVWFESSQNSEDNMAQRRTDDDAACVLYRSPPVAGVNDVPHPQADYYRLDYTHRADASGTHRLYDIKHDGENAEEESPEEPSDPKIEDWKVFEWQWQQKERELQAKADAVRPTTPSPAAPDSPSRADSTLRRLLSRSGDRVRRGARNVVNAANAALRLSPSRDTPDRLSSEAARPSTAPTTVRYRPPQMRPGSTSDSLQSDADSDATREQTPTPSQNRRDDQNRGRKRDVGSGWGWTGRGRGW